MSRHLNYFIHVHSHKLIELTLTVASSLLCLLKYSRCFLCAIKNALPQRDSCMKNYFRGNPVKKEPVTLQAVGYVLLLPVYEGLTRVCCAAIIMGEEMGHSR